mmetsp:Transcript_56188/g.135768  ORF Transcript_56188/g.135768 Transcript_56188/m.135768 type:complete len:121 (-) Transcript_56188:972-1334(-)
MSSDSDPGRASSPRTGVTAYLSLREPPVAGRLPRALASGKEYADRGVAKPGGVPDAAVDAGDATLCGVIPPAWPDASDIDDASNGAGRPRLVPGRDGSSSTNSPTATFFTGVTGELRRTL